MQNLVFQNIHEISGIYQEPPDKRIDEYENYIKKKTI